MRLGIDLRCLPQDGSPGAGVAHAAKAIANAIARAQGTEHGADVTLYVPKGSAIKSDAEIVPLSDARRTSLVRALKEHPCDVLFVPSGAVPIGLPVPAIPWVHDVDIFSHPEWFPQSFLKRLLTTRMFLRGIKRAPIVFVVSEYTKRELLKLVSYPENRIIVTGEGGDPSLLHQTDADRNAARERLRAHGITRSFVLMLGTVEPRKNIQFITKLWPAASSQRPTADLVIAGKDGWKHEPINAAIKQSAAIRIANVDEELRRDLLLAASLVVTSSFSEGFGLVPLEAMQAGTPVLVSDRGALPEVTGGTGVTPLEDENAWKDQIATLLEDDQARHDLISRQSEIASRWSWERAGEIVWRKLPKN